MDLWRLLLRQFLCFVVHWGFVIVLLAHTLCLYFVLLCHSCCLCLDVLGHLPWIVYLIRFWSASYLLGWVVSVLLLVHVCVILLFICIILWWLLVYLSSFLLDLVRLKCQLFVGVCYFLRCFRILALGCVLVSLDLECLGKLLWCCSFVDHLHYILVSIDLLLCPYLIRWFRIFYLV